MLEALTILYDFPTKYHKATRRDDRIELPFLRGLVLGEVSDGQWCSYFLGRITFATTSLVELDFGTDYGNSEDDELIESYLQQRFHDSGKANGYVALLRGSSETGPRVHIHATSRSSSLPLDEAILYRMSFTTSTVCAHPRYRDL